jgi:chromate transporter
VTAAVVGVILNLSLWFGLHVLFGRVDAIWHGPLRLWTPEFASLHFEVVLLTVLSAVLLLALRLGILSTLAIVAAAALAWSWLEGGI